MDQHPAEPASEPSASMRSCIKTGCRWPAVATLSYRYVTGEVWLSDLGEDHPSTHDLCPHHADTLSVPRGWSLVDDRRPAPVMHEPSAAEIVERVARLRSTVDAALERPPERRRSRYDGLLEDLPRYEPDQSESEPAASEGSDVTVTASDGRETAGSGVQEPVMAHVGVAHDLAPVVRDLVAVRRRGAATTRPDDGDVDARGGDQSASPPDEVHETGLRGAIVVQLPLPTDDEPDGA